MGRKVQKVEEMHLAMMEGLTEAEKEEFVRGLRSAGQPDPRTRRALRESIRKARPDYTDEQVETFIKGR